MFGNKKEVEKRTPKEIKISDRKIIEDKEKESDKKKK